jgi:single-strand selective monofunctional uracil DNA glycosylase
MEMKTIIDDFLRDLIPLRFDSPVTHVYNPLQYARQAHEMYLKKYGQSSKEVILVGMNPGPWGMAQTGVPFGEITAVKEWLGIETAIGAPGVIHPKKPVTGFACPKSEVSGKRLWGWAKNSFGTPDRFFDRFFVANYCPLLFLEKEGKNRTPNALKAKEKKALFPICDTALRKTVELLNPRYVIGIGNFVRDRCRMALEGMNLIIGKITHPSPANPKANRGWEEIIKKELVTIGIHIDMA